eukprot:scaffold458095_cov28-Prasinocladus_malaysianus.AAC.2
MVISHSIDECVPARDRHLLASAPGRMHQMLPTIVVCFLLQASENDSINCCTMAGLWAPHVHRNSC